MDLILIPIIDVILEYVEVLSKEDWFRCYVDGMGYKYGVSK